MHKPLKYYITEVLKKVFTLSSIQEDTTIAAPNRIQITQIKYHQIFYKTKNKLKQKIRSFKSNLFYRRSKKDWSMR
jgi:hypothetical protein